MKLLYTAKTRLVFTFEDRFQLLHYGKEEGPGASRDKRWAVVDTRARKEIATMPDNGETEVQTRLWAQNQASVYVARGE